MVNLFFTFSDLNRLENRTPYIIMEKYQNDKF